MTRSMRHRTVVTVLTAFLMAISACSSGAGGGNSPEEAGPPKPGGTFTVLMPSDTKTLDPHKESSYNTHERIGLVYSRLLREKISPDLEYGDIQLEGDLAKEWEVSDDGLTYTFRLRDGVRWHDVPPVNGRELVADDVVATFERIRKEGFQAGLLQNVTDIEAPDDHTVVLRLSEPFVPLLNNMANHHMWILPREAIEGEVDLNTKAIGTGPFILERWDRDVATTYRKNPDYYEKDLPYLDRVVFKVVPGQEARVAAFRSGEVQYAAASTPEEADTLRAAVPDARMLEVGSTTAVLLYLNQDRKPFDDLRVRQAISMALHRAQMGKVLWRGGKYPAPVQQLQKYALGQEELKRLQPYDPERAKRLLAEAGYPNGFRTKLMVTSGYGPQYVRQAEWLVEDLAKVGIRVELEVVEYATYFSSRWPGEEYDMGIGPQTPFLEPDEHLRVQLHSDGARNWFNISDPKLDKMLAEQAKVTDPNERAEKIKEIQRYVLTEVVNPINVWDRPVRVFIQPNVQNNNPQPAYGFPELRTTWLAQ
ncbi:MAG: ABC transporter substrate-binding protein [Streptosporangiales bacterium]|nr:ABC transporter substrate-binding protein [Streptosporangiales bacterium]